VLHGADPTLELDEANIIWGAGEAMASSRRRPPPRPLSRAPPEAAGDGGVGLDAHEISEGPKSAAEYGE
jgi:hypothetical protein